MSEIESLSSSSPPVLLQRHSENPQQNVIEVTGEASVAAAPNRSVVTLGAVTENKELLPAQQENSAIVTRIIAALGQLGVPKEHIRTADYRIDMQYSFEDGKQLFQGYQVTHLLEITLDQIDRTGTVVDTAVRQGANTVTNIRFVNTHPEAYYNQALQLAIRQAENKAISLARAIQATLNRTPLRIEELSQPQPPAPFHTSLYAAGASGPTPIQPGQLSITAQVRARYSYV
ncbi:SIMPL domain-containing protein [Paenibacillus doosanensis]|uniref:SIMPL domain-containing protein n=1 Tax=Paenibacillus doosanensis TaxID=1229154 RepID=UPI00217FC2B6|nr:SIMPL domain-containing protein [Paenibacillus doosanensis]MCS7460678.1 SIMPL domain-containing protein [Paenibacillus doosanensis]